MPLTSPVVPLAGRRADYDALLDLVGDRTLVLLGEASHGTHEFYRARAHITRRLVEERGFTAVAVEADWPDAYRVNRWVRGRSADEDAEQALRGFRRFPTWMWRNTAVRDFVHWLRTHNAGCREEEQAGFYGIDLYSLHTSMEAVLQYLDRTDPEAARRARQRYACFEHFGEDPQRYGYAASFDLSQSCEDAVVQQLVELRQQAGGLLGRDGEMAVDDYFYAEQNARLVLNAERYYRAMFRSNVGSWNLRDTHMADTLDALCTYLSGRRGAPAKVVLWAHNSHLGDARATELGDMGELNVGQLVRERHGEDGAVLVGFTTHTGSVTAASEWDEPPQHKAVRPSLPGSVERLFHETADVVGARDFFVDLREPDTERELADERLERAIGVIYRPETERMSHYFNVQLSAQFDAVFHFDETSAVHPLDPPARWPAAEPPETFPSGM
ncbi:MAG TPA: erythromycin esterase family protein [Gemmatimonadaceae bacterium]|nr:erythromycin esterase family protein [Gemmatimonadaceae bacterium]